MEAVNHLTFQKPLLQWNSDTFRRQRSLPVLREQTLVPVSSLRVRITFNLAKPLTSLGFHFHICKSGLVILSHQPYQGSADRGCDTLQIRTIKTSCPILWFCWQGTWGLDRAEPEFSLSPLSGCYSFPANSWVLCTWSFCSCQREYSRARW